VTRPPHPSFANPTIQEALCEVRFRRAAPWDGSLFGEFYKRVQKEFPNFEPVMAMAIQLQTPPGALGQALAQQMMRYKNMRGDTLLQLAPEMLTVNALPKYPGWDVMRQRIAAAWREALSLLTPEAITRIGLRYINRIERTSAEERAESWLSPNDYIPKAALASESGSLSRVECRAGANRFIVTLGEAVGAEPTNRAIILDIDCVNESEHETTADALTDAADALHDVAWEMFEASLTPRLRARLEGKAP
jgi:uncharacterized protein (TIGR04255 family)